MTLRHLHIFRTVCRTESITQAADKLNMTQPAVSIVVRELENYYDTKLFERMNRRIYLTEAGKTLWQYADAILAQFDESLNVIRSEMLPPVCRIGANVTFAEMYLSQWIKNIKSQINNMELSIYVNDTENIEKKLMNNEIDFAIVDKISEHQDIESRLLYSETMCVVCSPERYKGSMHLSDLCTEPLLLREKGSGNRNAVEASFYRHGLRAVPFAESISTLSLLQMTKAGLGFSILPRGVVDHELNSHSLREVPVTDERFDRYYHLIYHKNKYLTKAMKEAMAIPFM